MFLNDSPSNLLLFLYCRLILKNNLALILEEYMRKIFARANLRKSVFYLINNKINIYRVTQIMSHTFLTLFANWICTITPQIR